MTCANNATLIGYPLRNVTLANGVVTRGFYMGIGSPMQYFAMSPDFSDDTTLISNAAQCAKGREGYCVANYGGIFNISQSRTYTSTVKAKWNGSLSDLEGTTQPDDSYTYFNDDVFLQGNTSYVIRSFPMLTRNSGFSFYSSIGLGLKSLFMDQLVKSGLVRYKGWGLWMGSRSIKQPVAGTLWLGGYDSARLAGDLVSFSYDSDACPLCFSVTNLTYQYNGGSIPLVANSSQIFTVRLNPYSDLMNVPLGVYRNLIQAANTTGVYSSYQQTNNWLAFNTTGNLGDLVVTLRKGSVEYKTTIPAAEWLRLPQTIDDNGKIYLYNNTYQLSSLYNDTNPNPPHVWGGPFFTMNYMVMDYEKQLFQLAPARQGAFGETDTLVKALCTGLAPPTPTDTSTHPTAISAPEKKTPTGAIAGGVVGGIAGLIIVAALIWFLLRSKKREKAMRNERDAALAGGSEAGRPEGMSQVASSPTVVSETYGPNKAFGYQDDGNVNQWLHGQPAYVPQQYAPAQNYPPQAQQHTIPRKELPSPPRVSATPEPPSEMPAYQYR